MTKKTTILISGHISLDPLGRHAIAFLNSLLENEINEVYVDRNYLYDDKTLNELFPVALKSKKIHFAQEVPYDFDYDFLIFTDLIPLRPCRSWGSGLFNRNAKMKICYPVFDGSVPPLHWIEVINKFDLCLCPSEYCAHNLRRYGVTIDCFGLECATLIEDFLKIKPFRKKDNVFRIGSIGASDFRKNLPLLMRSFTQAFSKKDKVELFIHSSYGKDITCGKEILKIYEECLQKSNIVLQLKKISHAEMSALWASFDAYISPQTTTGYFTTPLEACAVGLPVILSNIHPHLELKKFVSEKGNLFFVKHDQLSSAFHWVFDYRNLGVKFDATEESYVSMLRYVYQHRNELCNERLVQERKIGAAKLSAQSLAPYYDLILHPPKIAIADSVSHLDEKNGIFFMSEGLTKKYEKYGWGKAEDISDTYVEKIYPEECLPVFKALESTAVESQKIWMTRYEGSILSSKWMERLLSRAERSGVKHLPSFIYRFFSLYCKIQCLLTKERPICK